MQAPGGVVSGERDLDEISNAAIFVVCAPLKVRRKLVSEILPRRVCCVITRVIVLHGSFVNHPRVLAGAFSSTSNHGRGPCCARIIRQLTPCYDWIAKALVRLIVAWASNLPPPHTHTPPTPTRTWPINAVVRRRHFLSSVLPARSVPKLAVIFDLIVSPTTRNVDPPFTPPPRRTRPPRSWE